MEDERVQDWVRRAREGDPRAFEEIVSHFQRRVWTVAYQLTGNPDDAQEVAQEAFLRAHRYLDRYRPDRPFTPWLLRIAVNASYRHMKRSRPPVQLVSVDDEAAREIPAPGEGAAESAVLEEERRQMLLKALDELAPRERAVFVLREMQGLPTEEVARVLGIRAVTVRRHASRARARLLDLLKDSYT